jgi:uncharacterized membrane protein YhiD involved in acid resistance
MNNLSHGPAWFDFSSLAPAWLNSWFTNSAVLPSYLTTGTYLPPLTVAILLGIALGYERRQRGKIAGVRTNMIVCASACLITMVGVFVFESTKLGDPARLPGQIIAGITFLGAGVIMKNGFRTQGITTAAVILFSTVIGILCGFGYLLWAMLSTAIIIAGLQLTYRIFPSDDAGEHTIAFTCPSAKYDDVRKLFPASAFVEHSKRVGNDITVKINVRITREQLSRLISANVANPDVIEITIADEKD